MDVVGEPSPVDVLDEVSSVDVVGEPSPVDVFDKSSVVYELDK